MKNETRFVSLFGSAKHEVRFEDGPTGKKLIGYIPYNSLSVDLGGFFERVMPTAFKTSLEGDADILALVDHSREKLIGRVANDTLRLADTPTGLSVEVDLPETSYANDIKSLAARGDLGGLSFGFRVRPNGQRFLEEEGQTIRELLDVVLTEVSVVSTHPAYSDTSVALRAAFVDPEIISKISRPKLTSARQKMRIALMRG